MKKEDVAFAKRSLENFFEGREPLMPYHERCLRTLLDYVIELETKVKVYDDKEHFNNAMEEKRKAYLGPPCKLCGRGTGVYAGWCSECMSDHDL